MSEPKTLQEAILYFSDPDNCVNFLVSRRWPDGVVCPTCGRTDVSYIAKRRVWQCKTRHPKCQFSVKVGTVMEDSPMGLDKWLAAMWMIANCKNGISSYEIARGLGITQKSAWFMLHRIRHAMQDAHAPRLGASGGPVEVDETYIGPKPRTMHKKRRNLRKFGGKAIVMGLLERNCEVRAKVIPRAGKIELHGNLQRYVEPGTEVHTDDFPAYYGINAHYAHKVIVHAEKYVEGQVHTQGIENFWSLLKRGLTGTYISVEPFHLERYVDEQVFRFNNRINKKDADRFSKVTSQISGKRLTYEDLTGKTSNPRQF